VEVRKGREKLVRWIRLAAKAWIAICTHVFLV
jgi:hypothetical protein